MPHPICCTQSPCPCPWPPQETLKHSCVSFSVGSLGPGVRKVCSRPPAAAQRWSGPEEIHHIQGQERWLASLGRRSGKAQEDGKKLAQLWGDTPCPRAEEKPPQDCGRGEFHPCLLLAKLLIVFSSLSVITHLRRASQAAPVAKNLPPYAGDIRGVGWIPGSGRSPGGGPGNPLWYSCPENPWTGEPEGLWASGSRTCTQQ